MVRTSDLLSVQETPGYCASAEDRIWSPPIRSLIRWALLFEWTGVDGYDVAAKAQKASDLTLYGLDVSVRPSIDLDLVSEVLVIRAKPRKAAKSLQPA